MEQPLVTMELLKQSKEMLNRIYDIVRIINPLKKKQIEYQGNLTASESDFYCYELWNKNKMCDNCISMRAFTKKEVFFKLEFKNDRIYMLTAVPVQSGNDIVVLELLKDVSSSILLDEDKPTSSKLLNVISSMNQLQVRDSLTGLYNRRYLDERLPVDIANSIAGNAPLSVILADIDHFKHVNDTYGHIAGDYVLKQFAHILESFLSENNGWVSRYGGEEFLITLVNTGIEGAGNLAERIRQTIEGQKFLHNDTEISITSSFGAAMLPPGALATPEELINTADKHLYAAKNSGRNKVVSGIHDL